MRVLLSQEIRSVYSAGDTVVLEYITPSGVRIEPHSMDEMAEPDLYTFDNYSIARLTSSYGTQWRCWDGMPTAEERNAEKALLTEINAETGKTGGTGTKKKG